MVLKTVAKTIFDAAALGLLELLLGVASEQNLKFQLATLNISPHSSLAWKSGHRLGSFAVYLVKAGRFQASRRFRLTLAVLMLDIETHGR